MSLNKDLKYKFSTLNALEKIIAINAVIFLVHLLLTAVRVPYVHTVFSWFELPSEVFAFAVQPWSIVSYAFLHYDFFHILFNMLWLYFIGRMFMNVLNQKTALNVYFLGAICGGLLYLLCYNVFPQVFGSRTQLVGASAAVRALLIFLCAYLPQMELRFFTVNLKLWYIGAFIVVLDIAGLFGMNAGGNLAHLGGAVLGYFYAVQLKKGTDIGRGFERLMDTVVSWFKKTPKKPSNLKTVYKKSNKKNSVAGYNKDEFSEFNKQKRVDLILDKISKSGYDSLTKEEKEFLFRAGK